MDYDLTFQNEQETSSVQQINTDINAYLEAFAEEYCRNMRSDMQAQVTFIERLEK